ncbi:MAG: DUF2177 family protein [Acidobacteriota bacterium]|jgi:uncharacterized membrane protein|nr:DUF2177 family protein [Acidobacteriota bacterium]
MENTMMNCVRVYLITIPIFFVIDLIWLGVVARGFYQKHLGYLMRTPINWTAAIIFYLLFIVGIVFFAIKPALESQSPVRALVYGALFGFFTYATYDLTNLATIKNWPVIVTVVDLAWGTVLCGAVAWGSYLLSHRFVQ